jgi:hypothetical protein
LQIAVRATITGAHPVAYVAEGADLQIVRVGDIVAGRRVAEIDLRGLALSDGLRVDLPESYLATPQPAPAGEPDVGSALSDLARLRSVVRERGAAPAPTPVAAPAATTLPAAAGPAEAGAGAPGAASASATPAPIRTVDSRGIAPGVNPTPDTVDPTAFPYPYPYPPPH